jgi:hypothetical protein
VTYADTYKRRAELRSKLGNQRLADLMAEQVWQRRLMASARHMAHRVRLAQQTAYCGLK